MKKTLFILLIIMMPLSVGIYFKVSDLQLTLILGGTIAAFFIVEIDRIKIFKLSGLEVELQDAIHEANVTADSLRSLMKLVILRQYDELFSSGRYAPTFVDDSDTKVKKLAVDLNLYNDPEVIEKRKKMYYRGIVDALVGLSNLPKKIVDLQYQKEKSSLEEELVTLKNSAAGDYTKIPTPKEIQSIFDNYRSVITGEMNYVDEYNEVYQKQMDLIRRI